MATITEQLTYSRCTGLQEAFIKENWKLIRKLLLHNDEKWIPLQNSLIEAGVKLLERLEADENLEELHTQEMGKRDRRRS